jgi:hypothetical protein
MKLNFGHTDATLFFIGYPSVLAGNIEEICDKYDYA